jgi:hypothetical protein
MPNFAALTVKRRERRKKRSKNYKYRGIAKGAGSKMSRTLASALGEYSKVLWENTRQCFGRTLASAYREYSQMPGENTPECVGDSWRFVPIHILYYIQ